jgi:hypothetical protein
MCVNVRMYGPSDSACTCARVGVCLRTGPDAQELLLDNVMAAAKKMSAAQTTGNVHEFNDDVTTMNSGMTELESTLAAAQCPPTHGGQAALNMCLIKQQLGRAASLKQGVTNAKVSRTAQSFGGLLENCPVEYSSFAFRVSTTLLVGALKLPESPSHRVWRRCARLWTEPKTRDASWTAPTNASRQT